MMKLKDLLAGLMLERLSHTANTDNISFASFSLDYYPAEPLPGSKSSARDVMRRALEECRNYADSSSKGYERAGEGVKQ